MKAHFPVMQRLASGFRIKQDIRKSVRAIVFETGCEGWPYATHGGTAFIVRHANRFWGLTCKHVVKDFEWKQLMLTDIKFGKMIAGIHSINYPSGPTGKAIDSDVLDLAVIEFDPAIPANFFKGTAYVLDQGTIGTPRVGADLVVNGLFKDTTTIEEGKISPTFGLIEFTERGPAGFDLALRKAEGAYVNPQWSSLTGFSGAPVFDVTGGRLCGMVMRASMPAADRAIMHYLDIVDIAQALKGVADGSLQAKYSKTIAVPPVR
jgi:hypothetical protein